MPGPAVRAPQADEHRSVSARPDQQVEIMFGRPDGRRCTPLAMIAALTFYLQANSRALRVPRP
jgi:hypothetical protein